MQATDDTYYIDRILKGDTLAYSHLVEKYKRMAYTLAFRMVNNPEDAEEIAQDAFVKAFRSLHEFRNECKFSTWLYKIIYHLSVTRLRKKKYTVFSIDDMQNRNFDITETDHFLKQISEQEQNEIVRKAIDRLPPEDKALITLFYHGEKSVKEITVVTGDSESNVKVKLFRARKRLWELLKHNVKDLTIESYDGK